MQKILGIGGFVIKSAIYSGIDDKAATDLLGNSVLG